MLSAPCFFFTNAQTDMNNDEEKKIRAENTSRCECPVKTKAKIIKKNEAQREHRGVNL